MKNKLNKEIIDNIDYLDKDKLNKDNELLLKVMMADPNQTLWLVQILEYYNISFEAFREKVEKIFNQ